jgi:hypothetical protein
MASFEIGRLLVLPRDKFDEKKLDYLTLKGAPVVIKTGPKSKPIQIGFIRDIFLNPREGLYADITIAAEIGVEVDEDKNLVGVFMAPGPS